MTRFLTAAFASLVPAVLAVLLSTFAANAATFTIDADPKGGVIVLEGEIVDGDDARLVDAYKSLLAKGSKPVLLALNSLGGHVKAGAALSAATLDLGLVTGVGNEQTCASICVLVWATGTKRLYQPHARIGVHSVSDHTNEASNGNGEENLASMGATALIARALVSMGAPDRVVIKMLATDGNDIAWLTSADVGDWATLVP